MTVSLLSGSWLVAGHQRRRERLLPAFAPDLERHVVARCCKPDLISEVAGTRDVLSVQGQDDIARLKPRLGCGTARYDARYQRSFRLVELERIRKRLIQLLNAHAELRAIDLAGGDDLVLHIQRDIDGDGE